MVVQQPGDFQGKFAVPSLFAPIILGGSVVAFLRFIPIIGLLTVSTDIWMSETSEPI